MQICSQTVHLFVQIAVVLITPLFETPVKVIVSWEPTLKDWRLAALVTFVTVPETIQIQTLIIDKIVMTLMLSKLEIHAYFVTMHEQHEMLLLMMTVLHEVPIITYSPQQQAAVVTHVQIIIGSM